LGRRSSPTSPRYGDVLGYIRIWATLSRRLVFWDGAPSPSHRIGLRKKDGINKEIKIGKEMKKEKLKE